MLEIERYDDVMQDAETYTKDFPTGKHIREIRRFMNKARIGGASTEESTEESTDTEGVAVEVAPAAPEATTTTEEE